MGSIASLNVSTQTIVGYRKGEDIIIDAHRAI